MSEPAGANIRAVLERIARRERGRLIANLAARLGNGRIDLAEDVAQEAVLAALATWPYRGMPDNPAAWLARVARNRALDRLRRERFEMPSPEILELAEAEDDQAEDVVATMLIPDPELRLMFLCCRAPLAEADRVALALRIVSGFTAREIGTLLLAKEDAVAQRLTRARRQLRSLDDDLAAPLTDADVDAALDAVLRTVYLLFSLGYAPRSGDRLIRRELTDEALRLIRALAADARCARPDTHALAALIHLQAARLDARVDAAGRPVLLPDQDRGRWDAAMSARGLEHLAAARRGDAVSRWHVEAGIAAAHALAPDAEHCDWAAIDSHYRLLLSMTASPVVAVNAALARARAGAAEEALALVEEALADPRIADYAAAHLARAEILDRLGRSADAGASWARAGKCRTSLPMAESIDARAAERS